MTDHQDRLKRLLDDLHKLEINTIEKPNLTATKMPAPILAVHDIYGAYRGRVMAGYGEAAQHADIEATARPSCGALAAAFTDLMNRASDHKTTMKDAPDEEIRSHRIIFARIAASCEVILGILERNAAKMASAAKSADAKALRGMERDALTEMWPISLSDRAEIRKIWEVGTESVLMQTVIQIEGDVITRMNSAVARGQHPEIIEVHKQSIEISLRMWGQLVDAAERLLTVIGQAVGVAARR